MSRHHRHKNGEGPVRCEWYAEPDQFEGRCSDLARYTFSQDSPDGYNKQAKRYCPTHLYAELDNGLRQARHPSDGWVKVRFAPGLIKEYASLATVSPG